MSFGGLLIAAGVVFLLWMALAIAVWINRPSGASARDALRLVPDVVRLVRSILADPGTPRSVRVMNIALLVWLVSPIDLIPEFLPVIGSLDDIVIAVLVLRWTVRRLGPVEIRRHWTGSASALALLLGLLRTGD